MNYKNIRLDKSLYKAEGGFSHQLEQLDPSAHYKQTEMAGLDAFERQLKRFDIKVSGPSSDPIAKFFASTDSAALFPEYVARAVAKGSKDSTLLGEIIASTTQINALDYRSITTDLEDFVDQYVDEGDTLPEVSIKLNEALIRLRKRGRLLSASYEAIKHQRTDVLTVALRQIGYSLANVQFLDAVDTLVAGDGTVPAADVETVTGDITYEAMLDLWDRFYEFDLNVILAPEKRSVSYLLCQNLLSATVALILPARAR